MDASQVPQLKVAELKEELKRRGLPLKGLKADLVERLLEAIQAEGGKKEPDANEGGELKSAEHGNSEAQQEPETQEVSVPPFAEKRKATDGEDAGMVAPMEANEAANQEVALVVADGSRALDQEQPDESSPGNVVDPAPVATSNAEPPPEQEEGPKKDVMSAEENVTSVEENVMSAEENVISSEKNVSGAEQTGAEEGVVPGTLEADKADTKLATSGKGAEHDVEMVKAPDEMEADTHKDTDVKADAMKSTTARSQEEAAETPKEVNGAKRETGLKRSKEEDGGFEKEESSEGRPAKLQKVEERAPDDSRSLDRRSTDVSRPSEKPAAHVSRHPDTKGTELSESSEKQAVNNDRHAERKDSDVSRPSDQQKEPQKGSVKQAEPEIKSRTAERAPARPAFGRSPAPSNGDKKREVPASARPPTRSVRVNNLVRPFTEKALRALLSETGTIEETGFWMDSIKTHCYVTFKSVDEAVRTREALFNLQWPPMGGRHLAVSFVPESEVEGKVKGTGATNGKAKEETAVPKRTMVEERQRLVLPVKDRLTVPSAEKAPTAVQEPPVLSLDDLFRKTTAKPPLYWLPLTDEQVQHRKQEKEGALATKGKAA